MASKKDKGEPVGWVTVKGKHFPKWADGTIGWQDGQEDEPNKSSNSKTVRTSEIGTTDLEGYEKGTELDVEGTKYTKVGKYWQDKNGKKWDSHKLYKEQLDGDDFDITVTSPSKKSSKATDTKSGYTVMMNTKDGFKEAKTFKSAAEADDYITKQVKSGNGISTDWNIKKNG